MDPCGGLGAVAPLRHAGAARERERPGRRMPDVRDRVAGSLLERTARDRDHQERAVGRRAMPQAGHHRSAGLLADLPGSDGALPRRFAVIAMHLTVGTSGYSYKEWKGTFYPDDLPAAKMLPFYAQHFQSV